MEVFGIREVHRQIIEDGYVFTYGPWVVNHILDSEMLGEDFEKTSKN